MGYKSPCGDLEIGYDEEGVAFVNLNAARYAEESQENTTLSKEIKRQFDEYFSGKRKTFDLPLNVEGTEFQKTVWNELRKIPFGETRSYGAIAAAIGNPKASRAVGMANNKNRIAIIIPCHRVIGANGKLVGYAGGLEMKKKLLDLEKSFI